MATPPMTPEQVAASYERDNATPPGPDTPGT
jgi:hypothetical protein